MIPVRTRIKVQKLPEMDLVLWGDRPPIGADKDILRFFPL
jgi:hypothetical protein